MQCATDRLLALRVADVMSRNIFLVSAFDSMEEVATRMAEKDVSFAPVIDEQGACVGILSAADFLKRESVGVTQHEDLPGPQTHELIDSDNGQPLRIDRAPQDFASRYMTDAVQCIPADVSLVVAARMMCSQHVHRLPVLDENERPVGVVSTMDVVSALVTSIDEMKQNLKSRA